MEPGLENQVVVVELGLELRSHLHDNPNHDDDKSDDDDKSYDDDYDAKSDDVQKIAICPAFTGVW